MDSDSDSTSESESDEPVFDDSSDLDMEFDEMLGKFENQLSHYSIKLQKLLGKPPKMNATF